MRVIAILIDGTFLEVPIPEKESSEFTPAQAINYAKNKVAKSELERVEEWEVEEDFI